MLQEMIKLTLVALMFAAIAAQGQTVNGVKLQDLGAEYIQVAAPSKANGTYFAMIDYGQQTTLAKDKELKGVDGKQMKFTSEAHILNYLYSFKYEYVGNFIYNGMGGSTTVLILRRQHD